MSSLPNVACHRFSFSHFQPISPSRSIVCVLRGVYLPRAFSPQRRCRSLSIVFVIFVKSFNVFSFLSYFLVSTFDISRLDGIDDRFSILRYALFYSILLWNAARCKGYRTESARSCFDSTRLPSFASILFLHSIARSFVSALRFSTILRDSSNLLLDCATWLARHLYYSSPSKMLRRHERLVYRLLIPDHKKKKL